MAVIARRAALATAAVLAACRTARAQGGELRLGALYPASGGLALLGDESFRGLELAVEERNGAGGVLGRTIRLVKADATDPGGAAAELRRLVGERVAAVFGTYASAPSLAATQAADLAGLPYFELGAISDPITERGLRGLFRTCPRASDFARTAVSAVAEVLAPAWGIASEAMRVAILHEEGPYGSGVAGFQEAQLRARGLNPVERIGYAARVADLSPAVQRLRGAGTEVLLHTGYGNDIVLLYRGLREAGWRPRMVIGAGAGYSAVDTCRAVGPAFDGTLNVDFTQYEVNERVAPGARAFAETYRRRYGSDPRSGHSLANAFGAGVCLDALHRAGGPERDRVRAALLATDVAEGATPTGWGVRFDERGQNTRCRPFLLQWQGDKQVTVLPPEAAVAQLRS